MAQKKKPFSRVRLVYQRSSPVTKIIVLITLVVTTIALIALTVSIRNNRALEEENRRKAAELEQQNAALRQDIQSFGSVEGDKQLAEKELGYVDKDAIIITPAPSESQPRQESDEDASPWSTVLIVTGVVAVTAAGLYIVIRKTKSKTKTTH